MKMVSSGIKERARSFIHTSHDIKACDIVSKLMSRINSLEHEILKLKKENTHGKNGSAGQNNTRTG